VRIAAQLACERDFRVAQATRTREAAATLFGDASPVIAFADALTRLVRG
jgi:hypothetical protein